MSLTHWNRTQIVNTTTTGNQQDTSVAVLDGGGFVVVWTDTSTAHTTVKGQMFDAGGSKAGSEFTVSSVASLNAREPSVTAVNGGGFVVSYTLQSSSPDFDIYSRIYNSAGTPMAAPILYSPSLQQDFSHITRLGTGFAAVFNDDTTQTNDARVGIFDASGTLQGSTFLANTTAAQTGAQNYSAIAQLANGNLVVAWTTATVGEFRIFNSSGVAQTAQMAFGTGGANYPQVIAYGNGGFSIAWNDNVVAPDGGSSSSLIQTFNSAGTALNGTPVLLNMPDATYDQFPQLTALPDGNLFGAWQNFADGNWYGRVINPISGAAGSPIAISEDASTATNASFDNNLTLATLGDGRVVATWTDTSGTDGAGNGVETQIIDPRDGLVTGTSAADIQYGNQLSSNDMSGLAGNDTMYGGAASDWMNGGAGNDTLVGYGGNDTMIGGAGDDTNYAGLGDDTIYGEDGNDYLWGEAGNDFLAGQNGNDTLLGQDGNDFLYFDQGTDVGYGGTGGDQFYWNSYTQGADIVQDFNRAEGDQIWFDHTGFGMPAGWNLQQGFNFFYGPGVTPTQATATVYFDTNNNILFFDIDGSGAGAATAITFLVGTPALQASDIHFV